MTRGGQASGRPSPVALVPLALDRLQLEGGKATGGVARSGGKVTSTCRTVSSPERSGESWARGRALSLLLVWTVGAAAPDGVVEGGLVCQRFVTWAVLCLVFLPTVGAAAVFLLAALLWTAVTFISTLVGLASPDTAATGYDVVRCVAGAARKMWD